MDIEKEILNIQERNRRVEMDKTWELSFTKRLVISVLTYIVAAVWLFIIREPNFWWKAFVPVAGYVLSTISLKTVKNIWLRGFKA